MESVARAFIFAEIIKMFSNINNLYSNLKIEFVEYTIRYAKTVKRVLA
jgi:hypothetical protein